MEVLRNQPYLLHIGQRRQVLIWFGVGYPHIQYTETKRSLGHGTANRPVNNTWNSQGDWAHAEKGDNFPTNVWIRRPNPITLFPYTLTKPERPRWVVRCRPPSETQQPQYQFPMWLPGRQDSLCRPDRQLGKFILVQGTISCMADTTRGYILCLSR